MPLKGAPELVSILEQCEEIMGKLEKNELAPGDALAQVASLMTQFQKIAESSGLVALRRVGREIEKYVKKPDLSPEELTGLAFVFPTLKSGLVQETVEDIRASVLEAFEILGLPIPTDWQVSRFVVREESKEKKAAKETKAQIEESTEPEEPAETLQVQQEDKEQEEMESLTRAVSHLGVQMETKPDGEVVITVPPENLEKVQRLLAPADPERDLTKDIPAEDDLERKVLAKIKEFMAAFSDGDFEKAQEVLEELSSMQEGGEIFNEIGSMARQLYTAFKEFANAIDPALRELAEDYLPDSEDRLQHLMKLTEEAANTTLDCTERLRDRLKQYENLIDQLHSHIRRLKPIGESAHGRLGEIEKIVETMRSARLEDKEDIDKILSAQNFQDLSGQTVLKVMDVMKELQDRLVGIIKSFGVKLEKRKRKDELYGPAHEKMEGALKSQDEVDALLAQFGF